MNTFDRFRAWAADVTQTTATLMYMERGSTRDTHDSAGHTSELTVVPETSRPSGAVEG